MVHADSPANSPTHSQKAQSRQTVLEQVKALLIQLLRRSQGFIAAQTLPHLADRTCRVYLGKAHQVHQARCRRILRSQLTLDPNQLGYFLGTSIGDTILSWFERFFRLPASPDRVTQKHLLKNLLIQMAEDPEGLSLPSFMRHFPGALQFNLEQLLLTAGQVEQLIKETEAALTTLQDLAAAERMIDPPPAFSQGPDLQKPGAFEVVQHLLVLEDEEGADNSKPSSRRIRVRCYQPHPWPAQSVPVVIQSHGLASGPEDLEGYAQHLASHGYFVAAPWHTGSDAQQVRSLLEGKSQDLFEAQEFIDRPLDVSRLLDGLEQRNSTDFGGLLNLRAVGVMGYSFGAYTAFALAGATIDFEALETACHLPWREPNLSLLLQCQALGLPHSHYPLRDQRIQAIVSLDAVGSEVFGMQGMEQVQIPTLLLASSHDVAAPLVCEQIRLFQGLVNSHCYLGVMQGKTHIRNLQRLTESLNLRLKILPQSVETCCETPFDQYINALSVVFFNQHLTHNPKGLPQLTADYAAYLSQAPFELWLVSSTSSRTLGERLGGETRGGGNVEEL
ncbi:MAG: alpha/beta hydrolase [Cyanobacteria bacterium Co-bin13]|nr:alpha/beta hydrolase [Cyanobacteria bacterium Co-bin13]